MNAQFSFTGLRHAQRGGACEDACFLAQLDENAVGLGVFDGVSSCASGALAARTAEEALQRALQMLYVPSVGTTFEQTSLKAGFQAACKALMDTAHEQGISLEGLGTTMAAGIFDKEYKRFFWAQAGDSGMLALKATGEVCVVCQPQKGPAGGHQTYTALDTSLWCFGVQDDVVGVIAATDGVFDVLTDALTNPYAAPSLPRDCAPAAGEKAEAAAPAGMAETPAPPVVPNDIAVALWQLLLETPHDVALAALEDALSKPSGPFAYVTDDKTLVVSCSSQACAIQSVFASGISGGAGTTGRENTCKEGGMQQ